MNGFFVVSDNLSQVFWMRKEVDESHFINEKQSLVIFCVEHWNHKWSRFGSCKFFECNFQNKINSFLDVFFLQDKECFSKNFPWTSLEFMIALRILFVCLKAKTIVKTYLSKNIHWLTLILTRNYVPHFTQIKID